MKFEDYAVIVSPLSDEDGGGYLASLPDLPGCIADGETPAEALEEARDAFAAWASAVLEDKGSLPKPKTYSGQYVQRIPKTLHMRLAQRAQAEGVSLNQLSATLLAEGLGRSL
jgi:antitoxin HicB